MRYQQYKNKMLKIRKVIDFFYRFRFVFAGIIVAIIAGSITLDVSKGSITETTQFQMSYVYGEEITYSGSAFMGTVTYEFRKKGDEEWTEEQPTKPGQYEARAKSLGNHGYKYSKESSFEIKPYETTFSIKEDSINYGNDQPELNYTLLPGDRFDKDSYKVTYEDLTQTKTTAFIDKDTLKIFNSNNEDVTDCYAINTEDKEITFIPEKLVFTFDDEEPFTYTGDEQNKFTADSYRLTKGEIKYKQHEVLIDRLYGLNPDTFKNKHTFAIRDDEGNDYTDNYVINCEENTIVVNKAAPLVITSSPLVKQYDNEPFADNQFQIASIQGLLDNVHEILPEDVVFANKELKTCDDAKDAKYKNSFTFKVRDKNTGEEINPYDYYEDVIINEGEFRIEPIPVTIKCPDISAVFNNHDVNGYDEEWDINYEGDLYGDDFPKVKTFTKEKLPGEYSNHYTCGIYRKMMVDEVLTDVEVSSNYNIHIDDGKFNINITPITIKFEGRTVPYNGEDQYVYTNSNRGAIVSGSIPSGWSYSASVYKNKNTLEPFMMKTVPGENEENYKADESNVLFEIWDELGNPMNEHYDIDYTPSHNNDENCNVLFEFEESTVEKVDLNITVSDFGAFTYNNKTLKDNLNLDDHVVADGLQGTDEVKVSFDKKEQESIQNANLDDPEDLYNIGLKIQVLYKNTEISAAGNYEPHYNREPTNASVRINKKHITVYTPDTSKYYDATKDLDVNDIEFTDIRDEEDNPITDLTIGFDKNKKYEAPSANAGTYVYTSFDKDDLTISYKGQVVHNGQNLDNYVIDLVETGEVEIKKRPMSIYQDPDTIDYIFYDGEYHGVYNDSKEIKYTTEAKDQGLLSSKNHALVFTNPQKKNIANEDAFGGGSYYGSGEPDLIEYFGVDIIDTSDDNNSVKNNYKLTFTNDYVRINLIKKHIDLLSGSNKKVFDGATSDLYKGMPANTWVDLSSMNSTQFTTFITYFNENQSKYVNCSLDDNHRIQVKVNIDEDDLDNSRNVGTHTNYYDWRVVKKVGNEDVVLPDDYYIVEAEYGSLKVEKLNINVFTDGRSKEYDAQDITYPDRMTSIGYDAQQIGAQEEAYTRNQGAYLSFVDVPDLETANPNDVVPFNKEVFYNNFTVRTMINQPTPILGGFYHVGSYTFNVEFAVCYKNTGVEYTETDNVELNTTNLTLKYDVLKIRIEFQRTVISGDLEMRILRGGSLADGDVLYFGTERYTSALGKKPRKWAAAFKLGNVHIYRNGNLDDEVTDCYQIDGIPTED